MSIPAAAAAAAAPHQLYVEAMIAAVCLAVGVPLTLRLLRRGRLDLPERLPPGGSVWPLVMALVWGLLVWITVPTAYLSWRAGATRGPTSAPATTPITPAAAPATQPSTPPAAIEVLPPPSPPDRPGDLADLPPRDVAFVAAVPGLAVLLALVGLDLLTYGGQLRGLGFSLRQATQGLAAGARMSVAFVPLVFGVAVLAEWLYRAVGYVHPAEHDLLRVLGRSGEPLVRAALVLGATVVAPLSEELLFRGHAQTILRRGFARLAGRRGGESPSGFPLDDPQAVTAPVEAVPDAPPAWAAWGGIMLASALFAAVHAPWTWPPIFLLSLCLGWAYERTNNLWVPVAIHAAFNATSTALFLAGGG